MTSNTNGAATSGSSLQDHRQKPRGVLPRQLQMWLMVGIAAIILLVILITGRPQPAAQAVGDRPVASALPAADRIRAYQQQLKDEEARLHQLQAQAAIATEPPVPVGDTEHVVADPVNDEQRRREYQSLFADNVALSRRSAGQQPNGGGDNGRGADAPVGLSPETLAVLAALSQAQAAGGPRPGLTPMPDGPIRVDPPTPPSAPGSPNGSRYRSAASTPVSPSSAPSARARPRPACIRTSSNSWRFRPATPTVRWAVLSWK